MTEAEVKKAADVAAFLEERPRTDRGLLAGWSWN
jgi:hypothetical protein